MGKTKIIAVAGIGEVNFRALFGEPNTELYKKETDRLESGMSDKFDDWGKQGYDFFTIVTGEEQKGDYIPEKVAKQKGLKYKVIREPSIADVGPGIEQGRFTIDEIPFIKTSYGYARELTPDMQQNIDRIKASEWFGSTLSKNTEAIFHMEKEVKAGKKSITPISVGGDRQYRNNVVIMRAEDEAKKLGEPVEYVEIHSKPYGERDPKGGTNATRRKHEQHNKHNKNKTIYNYIGFVEESKPTESKPPVKKSTSSKPITDKFKAYGYTKEDVIGFLPDFKSPEKTKEPPEIEPDDSFVTIPYLLGLPADEPADAPYAKPVVLTPEQEEEIKAQQQFEGQSKIKTKEKILEAPWSKMKGKKRLKMIAKYYSKELASFGKAGKKPFDVSSDDWHRTKIYVKDHGIPKSKQEIMKRHSLALQQKSPEKLEIKRKIISEKEFSESLKDIPKITSILDDTRVDYTEPKETDADRPTGIHVINYILPDGKTTITLKPNKADYQELVQSMGKEKAEKYIANAWLGGGLNPYEEQYTVQYDAPDIKKFKVKKGVPIHGPARPGERRRSAYFAGSFDKLIPGPQTEIRRVLHTNKEEESKEETLEGIKKSGMNNPIFSTLKSQQEKEREKEAIKHKDDLQNLADEHGVDVKPSKNIQAGDLFSLQGEHFRRGLTDLQRKEYGMGEQHRGRSVKSLEDALEHVRLNEGNVQDILVDTGKKIIDSRGDEAKLLQTVAQATKQDIIDMPDSEYTTWFFSQLGRRQRYVTDPDAERIAGWAYYPKGHRNEGEKIVYLKGNEVVDSSNPQGKRTLTSEEIKAGRQGGIPSFGDVFKTKQWQHFNDDMVKSINEQRNQDYRKEFEFKGVKYEHVHLTKNIE